MKFEERERIRRSFLPVGFMVLVLVSIVALSACAQQQAATPTPFVNGAAGAQPTPSVAQASPTAAPPLATPTVAPASALPASTAPAVGQCSIALARPFDRVYSDNPNVARALGCATEREKPLFIAEQPFQKGFMYWRSDTRQIYAIMDTGRWAVFPDTWNEGDPSPSLGTPVPSGLVEPGRGFGKVWREQKAVRDALGWATDSEMGFDGVLQPFSNGTLLWSDRRIVWVLFSDGTWLRFVDAS